MYTETVYDKVCTNSYSRLVVKSSLLGVLVPAHITDNKKLYAIYRWSLVWKPDADGSLQGYQD